MNTSSSFYSLTCAELMNLAERELAAFISAMTELYGAEQARLSAEYWLDELRSMDSLPGFTARDWRAVTVAALERLTSRRTFREASANLSPGADTKVSVMLSSDCFGSKVLV